MNWQPIAAGIIPSIAVGLIFWYAMRAILRADRNERAALAKADAAHEQALLQSPDAELNMSPTTGESKRATSA